ncbi:MAG: IS5 family transposase [Verrucomicrobiaceae bacterium]|nr:MAG: IS5 family transposase [Verrucomicrobiaceae bacterium]
MAEIQTGFFTHELQLRRIDGLGDPLKALGSSIDFELFRPVLEQLLGARKGGPGRPPWDRLLMFKILVLQTVRGLSDEKLEFELIDSASAQRFVGLSPHDAVPDSRTIWLFRDTLTKARMNDGDDRDRVRLLFDRFHEELSSRGLLCREGRTVDAMIVEVPRQRNTPDDNKTIKRGGVPADWPSQPRKLAQKDVDARWARKNYVTYYGYKNSIVGGIKDGWVHDYKVCPANTHDSTIIPALFFKADSPGAVAYGDSAYSKPVVLARLADAGIEARIHEQRLAGSELTEQQKQPNRLKTKVRIRIEHRFGRMRACLGGLAVRAVGLARCRAWIGMVNLVYNLMEFERLHRGVARA